jgi:hypothetical protein
MGDGMPAADLQALFAAARARLIDSPQEALGARRTPGRILRRSPRITPAGSAWRVGVLLLVPHGEVLAVGEVLRAAPEVRRGYSAESARARAATRAAAVRGGFRPGETVHVGWQRLDLDAVARGEASGPLRVVDGTPVIRWSSAGALMPLDAYLRDRVALLLAPPEGA